MGTEKELLTKTACAEKFHRISGEAPASPFSCEARLRYRQPERPVTVYPLPGGRVRLEFDTPQRAPAPGQAAVLYQGDTVLGGGVLVSTEC